MFPLLLLLVLLAVVRTASSEGRLWCPPEKFEAERANRVAGPRVSLLTDIHGQLTRTGLRWGIFIDGHSLSRFIYHYVGMLGFDKAYINVMYNASIHSIPPTIEDLYPSNKSCVAEWAKLGFIDWYPYKYAGPEEEWEIDWETKKPSLKKDLYKVGRGITPRFNGIQKRNETDWLFVLDVDEFLVPINFQAVNQTWCHRSQASLISQGLDQMMTAAATGAAGYLMSKNDTVPCPHGSKPSRGVCTKIDSIGFAVYLWTNGHEEQARNDIMPSQRSRVSMAYDYQIKSRSNLTDEATDKYKDWKSIYRLAVAPPMPNTNKSLLLHFSGSNCVRAPRNHHALSFEVGHVKHITKKDMASHLEHDGRLQDLWKSFSDCMNLLI